MAGKLTSYIVCDITHMRELTQPSFIPRPTWKEENSLVLKFELPLSSNSWTLFDACIWYKLDSGLETFKLMFSYVRLLVVCMSSKTDHCDAICLDLLSKLLYPPGLGKKAVFVLWTDSTIKGLKIFCQALPSACSSTSCQPDVI